MKQIQGSHTRMTLGAKIALFAVILVSLVSGSMSYVHVYRSAVEKKLAMGEKFASMAKIIAGIRGSGYQGRQYDPELIKILVDHGAELSTHLCFAVFVDAKGQKEGMLNLSSLMEAAPSVALSMKPLKEEEQWAFVASLPPQVESLKILRVNMQSGQAGKLGLAYLGFSTIEMEHELARSSLINGIVAAIAFLVGLLGALWLASHFSQPIREVARAMQRVSGGKLDETLQIKSKDEIGVLAHSFNVMTKGLRERERIRNTFARYVSDQVAERILTEENELNLLGELRQVSVLFLDIRGFTTLTEHLQPREVVKLLNDYFQIIIDIIFENEGTINKFIGDSIMAIYGAPRNIDFQELRAVITALEIQRAVWAFNEQRIREKKPVAHFGIGIHSGEAIAGNVGSARRMEYTVIGSDVNLAQRIESTTGEDMVLISEATHQRLKGWVEEKKLEPVHMKGFSEPIQMYEVIKLNVGSIDEARERVLSGKGRGA
jgi:class 3 adenylate cyclase